MEYKRNRGFAHKRGVYRVKTSEYVIINNRAYNPITGLPVDNVVIDTTEQVATATSQPSRARGLSTPAVHRSLQHSTTLNRRYVKKAITQPSQPVAAPRAAVAQSPSVQKFSATRATAPAAVRHDRPAQTHPIIERAANRTVDTTSPRAQRAAPHKMDIQRRIATPRPAQQKALKPAHVLKNEAIAEAMNREVASQKKHSRAKRQKHQSKWARFISLASASLAIVFLAGYFTYLSMPNISIRMAAVQSGVKAKYPGYQPNGYALNGPITVKDNQVSMQFAYNGDVQQSFTIQQENSSWNSAAVKQYVDTKSKDVTTTTVNGLTIYTYDGNASWINSGVLYTIDSNAPLSADQVQRIATSL